MVVIGHQHIAVDLGPVLLNHHPEQLLIVSGADYEEAVLHGVSFADGRVPDLVHAWTPRELVQKLRCHS